MSLVKSLAVSAAAAALLVTGVTPAPAAAPTKVRSEVTIKGFQVGDPMITFRGKVTSPKAFCKNGRKITLKQTDQKVVAGRTTSKNGAWKVTFDGNEIDPGTFLAIMPKKKVKKAGKTFVCAADKHKYTVEGE